MPAYTGNKACGSSAKALTLAAGSIILGEIDVALVVGMENMTRTPYLLRGMRGGYRMGPAVIEDGMSSDGFMDPLASEAMGETAENLAERYAVSREEQDAFALQSQRRAGEAWEAGRFADDAVPVDTFDAAADGHGRAREHPAGHHAGGAGQAQAGVPRARDGHRRELLGDLRRGRRPGRDG